MHKIKKRTSIEHQVVSDEKFNKKFIKSLYAKSYSIKKLNQKLSLNYANNMLKTVYLVVFGHYSTQFSVSLEVYKALVAKFSSRLKLCSTFFFVFKYTKLFFDPKLHKKCFIIDCFYQKNIFTKLSFVNFKKNTLLRCVPSFRVAKGCKFLWCALFFSINIKRLRKKRYREVLVNLCKKKYLKEIPEFLTFHKDYLDTKDADKRKEKAQRILFKFLTLDGELTRKMFSFKKKKKSKHRFF
ncbi:hypothetical protein RFI_06586 [Reticulomyxa filosa]|uniref:Uncharacterized protein n=1 Tax=Reticulomyxa filosa TaxID=46433 RepID=X6NXI5_RETFI|nr:hypothetical protein RFI_06586 [Reticulomyxa filosa]|eukprot:ETO30534.1 hypothetical protein RFI_06586 [Reticulomyxa filosa]